MGGGTRYQQLFNPPFSAENVNISQIWCMKKLTDSWELFGYQSSYPLIVCKIFERKSKKSDAIGEKNQG